MSYIFYCDKCKETHTVDRESALAKCPNCGRIMLPTHVTNADWNTKTEAEKEKIIQGIEKMDSNSVMHDVSKNSSGNSGSDQPNSIGKALNVCGLIYIALTIIGSIVLKNDGNDLWLAAGFFGVLSGLLVIGIGEIIRLLQEIRNKL